MFERRPRRSDDKERNCRTASFAKQTWFGFSADDCLINYSTIGLEGRAQIESRFLERAAAKSSAAADKEK